MIRRLKIKFVCINMLIVTVMLSIIFGAVLHVTKVNMDEQSLHALQTIHEDFYRRGPSPMENRLQYFTVMISSSGDVRLRRDHFFDSTDDEQLLSIAKSVYQSGEKQGLLKEHSLRFSCRQHPNGEEIVFLDVSVEHSIFTSLLKTCIKMCIVSYVLFLGISLLLARWAIRPVETAWDNQRQFVADASHELKTPLAVIMTNAELLQDTSLDVLSRQRFADSILIMSQQMRWLVEGLLDLARVDNGIVKTTFETLDFSSVVENALLPFEPLFYEKGMLLESNIEPSQILRGSQVHLKQVVDILLDNAVKYGDPDKPVTVFLQRQGMHITLSVSTFGETISQDDLKKIFRRFYRIDAARAMNQSYGLGLSIAQSIVRDHRGKIWAESRNGINIFRVVLPGLKQGK